MMSESTESTKSRESKRLYSDGHMATLHNREEKQQLFCEEMGETGNVAKACGRARIDRRTAYNWQKCDPAFAQAWDEAFQGRLDSLEEALIRRGTRDSDRAAFGMLKAHRREIYGDKVEVTGKGKIVLDWPEGEKEESEPRG